VRTLHHYDEIGLLKPAFVGSNGYRYYGREELLRLQQILLHRERLSAISSRPVLLRPELRAINDQESLDRGVGVPFEFGL